VYLNVFSNKADEIEALENRFHRSDLIKQLTHVFHDLSRGFHAPVLPDKVDHLLDGSIVSRGGCPNLP
jgi:hypothetical protein